MLRLVLVITGMILTAVLFADQFTTMKQIISDLSAYVTYYEDSLNQEIVHISADIIGKDGITFTRTFHQGYTYGITAIADWRVKDLDITIYKDVDGDWVEVESDDEIDNHPNVYISPSATAEYMVEIKVYTFNEDNGTAYTVAHYGLLVYHEM